MDSSSFFTVNPATGEQMEEFPFFTAADTETALVRAEKSFHSYRKLSVHRRAELLSKLAATLRKNKAHLAKVITTEMGKIFSEAEAEVEKCAWEADWYAEHGPQSGVKNSGYGRELSSFGAHTFVNAQTG
jgi:acyl-CoA reductase-like NAD-dependent aldehyde dehydrogenase